MLLAPIPVAEANVLPRWRRRKALLALVSLALAFLVRRRPAAGRETVLAPRAVPAE